MFVNAANHLNNFRCQQLRRTCNIIKVSHRHLLHFRFISIILASNDGDFNKYDGDRLPTSTGNILIWEKFFATFNFLSKTILEGLSKIKFWSRILSLTVKELFRSFSYKKSRKPLNQRLSALFAGVHKRIWTSDPTLRSSSWYRKQLAFYVNQSHSKP